MRHGFRGSGLVCALALSLVAAGGAAAQTAQVGTVSGTVTDQSGAVLPSVTLTLTSQERGFSKTAVTDTNGRFLFPSTPIGNYTVTATLSGFTESKIPDNLVETEKTTDIPISLRVAGQAEVVTVVGQTPIVDMTNTTVNTRVREEEFARIPVGRSYQTLVGLTPGVVGTGNVNAHGALSGNNQFLFDGVDLTDPTTGTFGGNLNFEAIQEVSVSTSGISAEYGRAVGAIVNVITKSGTNQFDGSFKYITVNDAWDAQNKTKNQVSGASLARTRFNHVNPNYATTVGGPIWRDRAWFFLAQEYSTTTSPLRQTVVLPEEFQESLESPFWNIRGTTQLNPNHNVWVKYHRSPTNGFMIDYWSGQRQPVFAGELFAMTRQDQGSDSTAVQWNAILRPSLTAEFMYADNNEFINVFPFRKSSLNNGAPHLSLANGFYFNGATFDGVVDRPRNQATAAVTHFRTVGRNTHSIKAGFDWQRLVSTSQFAYPGDLFFVNDGFNANTRAVIPNVRQNYDAAKDSTSKGNVYSLYVRDKFEAGRRLSLELGARYEKQDGTSDIGNATIKTNSLSPRLGASYALTDDGKTILQGTYGRFFQFIVQGFSDSFANVPQQANYDNYVWNGQQYVFQNRVEVGGSTFKPNTDLKPTHLDEGTIGFQRQVGRNLALGVRGVFRSWGDLIDDVRTFNPDGSIKREVVNYGPAERSYNGVELTFEKRYSNNWNAGANYTYGRTKGNQFANTFSGLGDYLDANCRTTVDPGIGTNGVLPCREVQEGANKNGHPDYDRPHSLKLNGAYFRPIGRVNLTVGSVAQWISQRNYTRQRGMNVLRPGTTINAGPTATYFYEQLGSSGRLDALFLLDTSVEVSFKPVKELEAGIKGEVFNVSDIQDQVTIPNTAWCTADSTAACTTARANFGKATARGNFQGPRTYRLSTIVRFRF
jgi:hypothetical protein